MDDKNKKSKKPTPRKIPKEQKNKKASHNYSYVKVETFPKTQQDDTDITRRDFLKRIGISAAAIAGAGVAGKIAYDNIKPEEITTITQLEEDGVDVDNLELSEETLAKFEYYDDFFESFENGEIDDISSDELKEIVEDIKGLHLLTIKEKISSLVDKEVDDISVTCHRYNSADNIINPYWRSEININGLGEWMNDNYTNKKDGNYLSKDLHEAAYCVGYEYDDMLNTINATEDKKSTINYLYKTLYKNASKLATGELEMDENGDITLIPYESEKEQENEERE